MLKYTTVQVTFREIPDEVTLCINISNCPIHCPDCHSKELWNDVGTELTPDEFERLIKSNSGITCVCFMGGDAHYRELLELATRFIAIKHKLNLEGRLKLALYSGRESFEELRRLIGDETYFYDYVKVGSYRKELGGLDKKTTNQRLFRCCGLDWEDITYKFWKKD